MTETVEQNVGTETAETKRDRVRRLLVTPLAQAGMRFPHRTGPDDAQKTLDRICDELAYAQDLTLEAVRDWALAHGDGVERRFWPPVVAFISAAQAFEPRPLEELPVIASWFGSRAGPAARDAGRLVAELLWIEKHRCPPQNDRHRKQIAEKASEWGRRVELATDRIHRGVDPGPGEREFLAWYAHVEARAEAMIEAGEARRAGDAGGASDAA